MNILVIGSGGREQALVEALRRKPSAHHVLRVSPPEATVAFCKQERFDLVVIGPEQPLVDGLADSLRAEGIPVFGPSAKGAQLEASKDFTKKLCDKYHVPTARYGSFTEHQKALDFVHEQGAPIVIKADGLAAGKGVTVAMTLTDAVAAVNACFDGRFGAAGNRVVIEEYLEGEEASFFALCDGARAVMFASAQDHKRAFDGDQGPNTGGMGTYSPTPLMTEAMNTRVMKEIIEPTMQGLKAEGISYIGVLFAGLMVTKDGPKLIEYNCRFGDPETQAILARFNGDLALLLMSCAQGKLDSSHLSFSDDAAICVVMAAKGYPGAYETGSVIGGLDKAAKVPGVRILHAGTAIRGTKVLAHGGRVLNVVATASTLAHARARAYQAVDAIDWPQGFCRRDIAWRALPLNDNTL